MHRPLMIAATALLGSAPAPQAPRELVGPRSLAVAAGRGEAVLFATDARGKRIRDETKSGPERHSFKEEVRFLRWAVVTGTVDFRTLRGMIADPPKAVTNPFWPARRIDLERQAHRGDGGWSDWAAVDAQANLDILDHLAEVESERIPPEARPEVFVDPLPRLKAGQLRGIDVEALIDPKLRDAPRRLVLPNEKPPAAAAETVMIRAFDFTAEPGVTYRYRARVVIENPAFRNPPELNGPWSEPTAEVAIPKDER